MGKIKYLLLLLATLLISGMVYAAQPDAFLVEVIPSTFKEGESVDLKITAVDADGKVVSDYDGDVFITANVFDGTKYTVPNDGIYTFVEQDQGTKLFSKGLTINASGNFNIVVEDILGEVRGSASVTVGSSSVGSSNTGVATVSITSPAPGTIVQTTGSLNIIGSSSIPNAPIFVNVNGSDQDTKMKTDANGGFNIYAFGLAEGDNTVLVKLKSADGSVLAQSSQITIELALENTNQQEVVSSFFITPPSDIYVGDSFTVGVITRDDVNSVEVTIGANKFPLDKFGVGQFGKEVSLQFPGTYAVQVHAYVDGQKFSFPQDPLKILEKVSGSNGGDDPGAVDTGDTNDQPDNNGLPSATTGDTLAIGHVGYTLNPTDRGTADVFWEPMGSIDYFVVRHGMNAAYLDKEIVVINTGIRLTGLEPETTVYVQIWPADADGNTLGSPSDALAIDVHDIAPSCVVKGINLWTEKKGDKYYLVWDPVDHAKEYVIYRSDFEVTLLNEMQEIGRTDLTSYPYPFDANAKNYEYAYYAVEAICDNNIPVPIDEIKKVQVGPTANIIAIMIVVTLLYFLYRVHYYSQRVDD